MRCGQCHPSFIQNKIKWQESLFFLQSYSSKRGWAQSARRSVHLARAGTAICEVQDSQLLPPSRCGACCCRPRAASDAVSLLERRARTGSACCAHASFARSRCDDRSNRMASANSQLRRAAKAGLRRLLLVLAVGRIERRIRRGSHSHTSLWQSI